MKHEDEQDHELGVLVTVVLLHQQRGILQTQTHAHYVDTAAASHAELTGEFDALVMSVAREVINCMDGQNHEAPLPPKMHIIRNDERTG